MSSNSKNEKTKNITLKRRSLMGGIWYLLRHSKARDKWSNIKFFIKVRKLNGQ